MIYQEDIDHLDMDHINKIATIRYENDHSIVKNIVDRINQSKFKAELIFEEIE
jgi:hypothetical protein